jgi:hypothetical protein
LEGASALSIDLSGGKGGCLYLEMERG